jgi:hypothetical protein
MPALGEVCGLVQQGRLTITQHSEVGCTSKLRVCCLLTVDLCQALQAAVKCCSQLNEVVRHVLFESVADS